jgi:hypothetical protein
MADANVWGVSVDDVSALAPHIVIANDPGPAPEPAPLGDPYNKSTIRKVTRSQVEAFIGDISAQVDLRLYRRTRIASDEFTARVVAAAQDVVTNGAGSYLVSAAFPVKAGVNESTSLSAELWRRYKDGLDALEATIDRFIKAGVDVVPDPNAVGLIRGNFPAVLFPDDMRF